MPGGTNNKIIPSSPSTQKHHQEKEEVFCFEHCNKKVFCVKIPDKCPISHIPISQCKFQIPPFKLPSPFSRAQDHPCAVVIKPTKGDLVECSFEALGGGGGAQWAKIAIFGSSRHP